jgi:hypothetical protein
LIVTLDATEPRSVLKNVLHIVIFHQHNGFGKKVMPGPDFRGELSNINLPGEQAEIKDAQIDWKLRSSNFKPLMSGLGQERRFGHIEPMSVLPPLATVIATCRADAKCQ